MKCAAFELQMGKSLTIYQPVLKSCHERGTSTDTALTDWTIRMSPETTSELFLKLSSTQDPLECARIGELSVPDNLIPQPALINIPNESKGTSTLSLKNAFSFTCKDCPSVVWKMNVTSRTSDVKICLPCASLRKVPGVSVAGLPMPAIAIGRSVTSDPESSTMSECDEATTARTYKSLELLFRFTFTSLANGLTWKPSKLLHLDDLAILLNSPGTNSENFLTCLHENFM